MQDASDDELMSRAGGGDWAAFNRLVARHLKRATLLAARMTGNAADAEEIVQEAFLRAWRKAPQWRPRGAGSAAGQAAFFTWFGRVIVNLCLDRKRRPAPVPLEAANDVADPAPSAHDSVAERETARRVAAAVAALPDRQRAALVMCYYEGVGNADAAAILGIGIGALESLLVRARRALRVALADLTVEAMPVKERWRS